MRKRIILITMAISLLIALVSVDLTAQEEISYYHHQDVVRDRRGNSISAASVYVYVAGTTTEAAIYSSSTGLTELSQPRTTDANGRYGFWCVSGTYDVKVSRTGIETYTLSGVGIGLGDFRAFVDTATGDPDTTVPRLYYGSYDPMDSLSAEAGSIYQRTAGVRDSILYLKQTGSDSSGWHALQDVRRDQVCTDSGNDNRIDVSECDVVDFNALTDYAVDIIDGGEDGRVICIYFTDDHVQVVSGGNVITKDGTPITGEGTGSTLAYFASYWREINRITPAESAPDTSASDDTTPPFHVNPASFYYSCSSDSVMLYADVVASEQALMHSYFVRSPASAPDTTENEWTTGFRTGISTVMWAGRACADEDTFTFCYSFMDTAGNRSAYWTAPDTAFVDTITVDPDPGDPDINITAFNGLASDGVSFKITGEGFGIKSPAAPLVWDRCDSPGYSGLTHGDLAPYQENGCASCPWPSPRNMPSYAACNPQYGTETQDGLTPRVAGVPYYFGYGRTTSWALEGIGTYPDTWFINWWFYATDEIWPHDPYSGDASKMIRLYAGSGYHDSVTGLCAGGFIQNIGRTNAYTGDNPPSCYQKMYGLGNQPASTWWQHEAIYQAGFEDDPNRARLRHRTGNELTLDRDNLICEVTGCEDLALLGYDGVSNGTDYDFYIAMSHIYVDTTLARVVITDNSNWEYSSVAEMQGPTSWAQDEIYVTLNQGNFTDGQGCHLWVVNGADHRAVWPIIWGDTYAETVDDDPPAIVMMGPVRAYGENDTTMIRASAVINEPGEMAAQYSDDDGTTWAPADSGWTGAYTQTPTTDIQTDSLYTTDADTFIVRLRFRDATGNMGVIVTDGIQEWTAPIMVVAEDSVSDPGTPDEMVYIYGYDLPWNHSFLPEYDELFSLGGYDYAINAEDTTSAIETTFPITYLRPDLDTDLPMTSPGQDVGDGEPSFIVLQDYPAMKNLAGLGPDVTEAFLVFRGYDHNTFSYQFTGSEYFAAVVCTLSAVYDCSGRNAPEDVTWESPDGTNPWDFNWIEIDNPEELGIVTYFSEEDFLENSVWYEMDITTAVQTVFIDKVRSDGLVIALICYDTTTYDGPMIYPMRSSSLTYRPYVRVNFLAEETFLGAPGDGTGAGKPPTKPPMRPVVD